ncbi:MAG TPA: DsbE family thiol:disulfide interchange protein [Geminicoccaceae bacterium]|nr:DsbE family thiol:disulfide interchange protein [Geminicoccaceae bacterium]
MRRLLYLVPVLVFGAVGIGLAVGLTRDPTTLPSALIDRSVPAFELPGLEGGDGLSSDDLKGRVVLVNVFASWCVPCRVEHPVLMRLAADGVPIFGINYKDPPDQAKAWIAEMGDPFEKIGADRSGRVGIEWGVYGVPETFVIDAEGRIRYRFVGPIQARDLDRTLRPMLAELSR